MDEIDFINERDVSVADILHAYADYDVRSHESPPAVDLYAGAFLGKELPENDFEVQEIARALCIYKGLAIRQEAEAYEDALEDSSSLSPSAPSV